MFGGMGNLSSLMTMAMSMGEKFQTAKKELAARKICVRKGMGETTREVVGVEIQSNGLAEIQSVAIDPSLLLPEQKDTLEMLLKQAIETLAAEIQAEYKNQIQKFAQEAGIPGLTHLMK
ncbi:MAG: YbaB/EbfC family nucleoid-associated protein [Planctomycetia bacterium]|nr:YbaB/EbfC family nucleoid-associated protein [Planctomycetia bacterium]